MFLIATLIGFLITTTQTIPPEWFHDFRGITLVLAIVLFMGAAIGFINGLLTSKFKILPFIVTLATGSILRGFGLQISDSSSIDVAILGQLSNGRTLLIPNVFICFVAVIVVFDYILRHTEFGRHLMAIGNSPKNAERAGIKVQRVILLE